MCGLVGLITKKSNGFTQKQKELFNTLLFVDMLRGEDSTGAFVLRNNGELSMAKDSLDAVSFCKTKEYQDLLSDAFFRGAAMIGHNRKATRGSITAENAHPFIVDDRICLVHNGTLYEDHKKHADVDVDSHAIAHLLAKHDVEEVINTIKGAFALIWYDAKDETLNFLRNNDRPLYWAELEDSWVWASEDSMLEFAAKRCGVTFTEQPTLLKPHTLCSYKLKGGSFTITNTDIKIVPKMVSQPVYQYNNACTTSEVETNTDKNYFDWPFGSWIRKKVKGYTHSINQFNTTTSKPRFTILGMGNCSVTQNEHMLGSQYGSLMTVKEYEKIVDKYSYNSIILAEAFDVSCVNEVDGSDGYFLWLSPVQDSDVILRHYFKPNSISEGDIIELASSGEFFNCKITQKAWHKVNNMNVNNESSLGWVLINVESLIPINSNKTVETKAVYVN